MPVYQLNTPITNAAFDGEAHMIFVHMRAFTVKPTAVALDATGNYFQITVPITVPADHLDHLNITQV